MNDNDTVATAKPPRRPPWNKGKLVGPKPPQADPGRTADRATVRQKKTARPVRFELTDLTREAIDAYLREAGRTAGQCLFPGRRGPREHLTTRQYARLVGEWVASIGLDPLAFGTHSMRRTKAVLIYRRTGNLRAVQVLFGPHQNRKHCALPRHRGRRCS